MNRLLLSLALLLPVAAHAQLIYSGAQATTYTGGTNKAVALSTNVFFNIDVPRAESVLLYCNYKWLNAPGAGDSGTLLIDFFAGIESGSYETNACFTWTVPATGTTPSAMATNVTLGSTAYLRGRIRNVSTNSHATNILFQYGFKR